MSLDPVKLRELLAEATPGPWHATPDPGGECEECGGSYPHRIARQRSNAGVALVLVDDREDANAALIVAAVNALPELLDGYDASVHDNGKLGLQMQLDTARAQLAASEAKAEAAEREAAELRSVYEHPNESGSVVGGLLALIKSTEAQRDEAVKALEAIASCGFPSEEADLARSALARIRGSK